MTIPWALFMTGMVLLFASFMSAIAMSGTSTWESERAWGWAATLAGSFGLGLIVAGIWMAALT